MACILTSREGIFKSPLKIICLTKKTSILGQLQSVTHIINHHLKAGETVILIVQFKGEDTEYYSIS